MDTDAILNNFNLPGVAADQIRARKLGMNVGQDGVARLSSEHMGGLPFSFKNYVEYLPLESKKLRIERYQDVDCIEWVVDSKNRIPARVHELPEQLLEFEVTGYRTAKPNKNPLLEDDEFAHPIFGECVGGMLKEAYDRYKQGLSTPGLPLNKWGVLSDSDCASLAAYGIFSVEQFAAMPTSKIKNGQWHKSVQDGYERAVFYANGTGDRAKDKELADKLASMMKMNEDLMGRLAALESKKETPAVKKGRSSKVEEILDFNTEDGE